MKAGWETKRLGEVCDLIARGVAPVYLAEGGIRVLNQKCVRDHRVNYGLARRHDATVKRVNPDRLLRLGDVLVNSTGDGTLGRVAQLRAEPEEPTTVDTHVTIVRPQACRFFLDFFGYMLVQIEDELAASGEGTSGQTELARSVLAERFSVRFPTSLPEQKRIVAILDEAFAGIDAAIANTEKNIESTREYFATYLDDVFSHPQNAWKFYKLGDVCRFIGGSQPPKSSFSSSPGAGKIRLIQIRDYKSDRHAVYIPAKSATRPCDENDVMIGRYGPPLFQILRGLKGSYNVALIKASPNEAFLTKGFLYYFLKNRQILRHIVNASSRAAGQVGLNKETIEPYPIALPPLDQQAEIVRRLELVESEMDKLKAVYDKKAQTLQALKQAIVQRAFAGELTAAPSALLDTAAA